MNLPVLLGDQPTRVLLAVLGEQRPTTRSVALQAGCSPTVAWGHLVALERLRLVTWEPTKKGTLRATVEVVR